MLGTKLHGLHHLGRLVEAQGPKMAFITNRSICFFCVAYVKKNGHSSNVYVINNSIGGSIESADMEQVSKFEYVINNYNLRYCCKISDFKEIGSGNMEVILLPDDFIHLYERFCIENRKVVEKNTYYMDNANKSIVALQIYSIVGDSKNFFAWACQSYRRMVNMSTIEHIIYWSEKYGQMVKDLSRHTITAYVSHRDIVALLLEQNALRQEKRVRDTINLFNTAQKQILRDGIAANEKDKAVISKFMTLSSNKKINFIKKMSTVESYDEIILQMRHLTKDHFSWNKDSFLEFINRVDGINFNTIIDNGDVVLGLVDDYETIKYVAKTTNWCISKNKSYWDRYVKTNNDAKQYVLLDFGKKEDDKNSIVGFTVRENDGIIMAHDFFNKTLMNENMGDGTVFDGDEHESYISHLRASGGIYKLLENHHIPLSVIIEDEAKIFPWNPDGIIEFIKNECHPSVFEVLTNHDGLLAIRLQSADFPKLCGRTYQMEPYGGNEHIFFFNFNKDISEPRAILYAIIHSCYEREDRVIGVYNSNNAQIGSSRLFNSLLLIYNLPFDCIRRPKQERIGWYDAIMSANVKAIETFIDNTEKLKSGLKGVSSETLADEFGQLICQEVSFDLIDLIYNHNKTLKMFLGSDGLAGVFNIIMSYTLQNIRQRSSLFGKEYNDDAIEQLFNRKIKNIHDARYYGAFYAIKYIMSKEKLDDARLINHILENGLWDVRVRNPIFDFIAAALLPHVSENAWDNHYAFRRYVEKMYENKVITQEKCLSFV